jgi:hypothetical protein
MDQPAYAGIGSRQTPPEMCALITGYARRLAAAAYLLRSGGARGADQAFESGAGACRQVFEPRHATPEAMELASRFHPAWDRCNATSRRLLARNGMIILGEDLVSPVRFVLCWTPDGRASGGTGQALRIAADRAIPIFNLHDEGHVAAVDELLRSISAEARRP